LLTDHRITWQHFTVNFWSYSGYCII